MVTVVKYDTGRDGAASCDKGVTIVYWRQRYDALEEGNGRGSRGWPE